MSSPYKEIGYKTDRSADRAGRPVERATGSKPKEAAEDGGETGETMVIRWGQIIHLEVLGGLFRNGLKTTIHSQKSSKHMIKLIRLFRFKRLIVGLTICFFW